MASTIKGSRGKARVSPSSEIMTETTRRITMKGVLRRKPWPYTSQLGYRFSTSILPEIFSSQVAGYRAFHLACPTGNLNADFRVLAQALHHALRALAGTEDVDAFDQNGQLD